MILEVRQLAGVEDLIAVELVCRNPLCDGNMRFSLKRNGLHEDESCPSCGELWWAPNVRSNVYRLLMALSDISQGTFHGKEPNPETEKARQEPTEGTPRASRPPPKHIDSGV